MIKIMTFLSVGEPFLNIERRWHTRSSLRVPNNFATLSSHVFRILPLYLIRCHLSRGRSCVLFVRNAEKARFRGTSNIEENAGIVFEMNGGDERKRSQHGCKFTLHRDYKTL